MCRKPSNVSLKCAMKRAMKSQESPAWQGEPPPRNGQGAPAGDKKLRSQSSRQPVLPGLETKPAELHRTPIVRCQSYVFSGFKLPHLGNIGEGNGHWIHMKGKGNCILHLLVIHVQVACYKYHTCRNQMVQWQWPSKTVSYRKFVASTIISIYPHWLVIAFPVKSGQGPLWISLDYTMVTMVYPFPRGKAHQRRPGPPVFATTPCGCTAGASVFAAVALVPMIRAWFFCTHTTQLQSIWSPEISLHVLNGTNGWTNSLYAYIVQRRF